MGGFIIFGMRKKSIIKTKIYFRGFKVILNDRLYNVFVNREMLNYL